MQDGIRPATAADEDAIVRLVRGARLNPRGLRWDRFVVAERDGGIVGVAQLRRHRDGSRELASLVVGAAHRDRGVAAAMVDALLARETGPVYTLIDRRYADHFARWGFTPIAAAALPPSVRVEFRVGRIVTTVGSLLARRRIRLEPLRRPRPPHQP